MTTSSTSDTGTTEPVAPELDIWRERVKAIETTKDMLLFIHDLSEHATDERDFYWFEDRDGIFGAMCGAVAAGDNAEDLREVAVALLVALSWDGEAIDLE
mgnify:CR=1 FL=1